MGGAEAELEMCCCKFTYNKSFSQECECDLSMYEDQRPGGDGCGHPGGGGELLVLTLELQQLLRAHLGVVIRAVNKPTRLV